MTPDELAERMSAEGKHITPGAVRYHCRDPRGLLYGVARRVGRSWDIPKEAADQFADRWRPYGSLKRKT